MEHKKVNWVFIVKKRLSWLSEILQVQGTTAQYFQKSLGVDFEFRNARMILFHEYLDGDELAAFDDMILTNMHKNPNYLRSIADRGYRRCDEFSKIGSRMETETWNDRTDKDLLIALREFKESALLMIPVVYFEPNLSEAIRVPLSDQLNAMGQPDRLDEYFLILTSTSKELTVIKEERDLLKIRRRNSEGTASHEHYRSGAARSDAEKHAVSFA